MRPLRRAEFGDAGGAAEGRVADGLGGGLLGCCGDLVHYYGWLGGVHLQGVLTDAYTIILQAKEIIPALLVVETPHIVYQ